ncbi:MAG: response regulator transcription factor [Acidimicrobiia bacterium]|nr:response regulator transcription factor [Acidimicrobiia bacterium]
MATADLFATRYISPRVTRILVVEDDPVVGSMVARHLAHAGFTPEIVSDGVTALAKAMRSRPDLVVLDLSLPSMDGMEVLRHLRHELDPPVIALTARAADADRIAGLRAGADDYITKPFHPVELVERVRAVLRRRSPNTVDREPLTVGPVTVHERERRVEVDGREVTMTALEFDLLAFLMRHPGEVFRREELLERVWGFTYGDTATVTVHVGRLRARIGDDPATPRLIVTVWGVGYSFDPWREP